MAAISSCALRRGAQSTVVHLKQLLSIYVPIAQLAEHVTFNHGVESSNLSGHTKIYAPLAQLVEQLTLNQWVQGSSP